MKSALLTNHQTAEILGLKPNTLEGWRIKGIGPKYRKIGRNIRYLESEVLEWIDSQARTSTSQQEAKR